MENKTENNIVIPKRILSSLLSSVSAGVVPRSGAPYIAIGRKDEIAAILSDLEEVSEGGAGMRFLIGRYGSGKSFLMQLIRGYALERDFITADIDLTPERRLYGSHGSGVAGAEKRGGHTGLDPRRPRRGDAGGRSGLCRPCRAERRALLCAPLLCPGGSRRPGDPPGAG